MINSRIKEKDLITHDISMADREDFIGRAIKKLSGHREILFAYCYGSFLQARPFRDFDIAVYIDEKRPGTGFYLEYAFWHEIVEELNPGFPIDICLLNRASVVFQFNVLRGRLLWVNNLTRWQDFLTYVVSHYLDIKPMLDFYFKEAFVHGYQR